MPTASDVLQSLDRWWHTLPAVVAFAALTLWLLNYGISELLVALASRRWTRIEAEVFPDPADCPHSNLDYRYQIGDRTYSGTRIAPLQFLHHLHKPTMVSLRKQLASGTRLTIRYDPRRPGRSLVDGTTAPSTDIVCYLLSLVVGVALIGLTLAAQPMTISAADWQRMIESTMAMGAASPYLANPIHMEHAPWSSLNVPVTLIFIYALFLFGRAVFWAWKSPKWAMVTGRIATVTHLWVAGCCYFGWPTADRMVRDVRYTYRAHEHRFESDRVTLEGNTRQSKLWGDVWKGEEPIEPDAIVPVYHRPGKPIDSALIPGARYAKWGIIRLGLWMLFWWAVMDWVGYLGMVHITG